MSLMERRRFLKGALAAGGAVAAGPTLFTDLAGAASTGSDTILVTGSFLILSKLAEALARASS